MKTKLLFTTLLLLCTPLLARADILIGPVTNPANGHLYYLLAAKFWAASEAEALTLGGHLVTINDADENRWVTDTFGPTAVALGAGHVVSLCIGLSDAATEGRWVWASGEPVTYTNWHPSQPSGGPSDSDFAGIYLAGLSGSWTPGQWHDFVSDGRYNDLVFGVVEVTVPPSPQADSFNPGVNGGVYSLAVQPDGKILVGGYFTAVGGQTRLNLARLNPDGSLDTGFNSGASGGTDSTVYALAVQPNGKILVGGGFNYLGGLTRNYLGRLNADGTVDGSYNPGANGRVDSFAMQADGKILVGGWFTTLGGQTRNRIARLNADGTLDSSFNPGANDRVFPVALQADGKILLGGFFTTAAGATRNRIARLNADGSLDTTFNPGANDRVFAIAVQADRKILVSGWFTMLAGQTCNGIGRLNEDGTFDPTFNPGSAYRISSLAVQADGKILVVGEFTTLGGQPRYYIGRFNPDGTLDASFNPGAGSYAYPLAVQADGKILVGGVFTTLGGQARSYLGRLNNTAPATESLSVDGSTITWLRGTASPEVWRTTFDLCTDGLTWTSLGAGTRQAGGWQLADASLPSSGVIRGRGYLTGGLYNGSGWFTESQLPFTNAPAIVVQPRSVTNLSGTTANFTVSATGAAPLGYQWLKDGTNLFRGTLATLTLTNVQLWDEGGYSVVVSNVAGNTTSQVAWLTVWVPPTIVRQPDARTNIVGQTAAFGVTAAGTPPFRYQWSKGGHSLLWATNSTLVIPMVQLSDAGRYAVLVSNVAGGTQSLSAPLLVIAPPCLMPVSDRVVIVGRQIAITNQPCDPDLPVIWSLGIGPSGASVSPDGVLRWTPKCSQGSSTNLVCVLAADHRYVPVTNAVWFQITVIECVEARMGNTVVRFGTTGAVQVQLLSTAALTNLSFKVASPWERLTNFALHVNSPQVITQGLEVPLPGELGIRFTLPATSVLHGPTNVGVLQFFALSNQSSAFVPLEVLDVEGIKPDGARVANALGQPGRVVVVGQEPLLEAVLFSNQQPALVVYALPGTTNSLHEKNELDPSSWKPAEVVVIPTNTLFETLIPRGLTNRTLYLRATLP